jgi:hypothetical protein
MGGPTDSQALIYGIAIIPVALTMGTLGFTFLFFNEQRNKRLSINVD